VILAASPARFGWVAAVVLGIVLGIPAGAGADHLEPDDISPIGASASLPKVASDGQRTVVAVWRELGGDQASIRAAVRTPVSGWSPAERVSPRAEHAEAHAVAMDISGNAVAVWQVWSGDRSVVQAAVRPAGGSWGPAQDLDAAGATAYTPSVAITAGRATVVWAAAEGGASIVRSTSYAFASPGWTRMTALSAPGTLAWQPRVATADDGSAVAVWRFWRSGHFVVQAAVRSPSGDWSPPSDLTAPGADARPPLVEMDAAGNAVAAWVRPSGGTPMAQVAYRPAGGAWGPARNLSHRGRPVRGIELDMNRSGDAIVTWRHVGVLWSSSRPRGSVGWQPRAEIDPNCVACEASVSLDETGNATAAWSAFGSIEASFKPVGEPWQERYLISKFDELTYRPDVVTDETGKATAAWIRQGENHDRVQSVAYTIETAAEEAALEAAEEAVFEQIEQCYDQAETDADFERCERLEDQLLGGDDGGERIEGTAHRDVLVGTPRNDVFYAYGGRDVIYGLGGRDVVYGGAGADRLFGGRGSDHLVGGLGADRLLGADGADRLAGGRGRDRLLGARGEDLLLGRDRQTDLVVGGTGLDRYRLDRLLDRARGVERRYSGR
jgi:hemolysin type calcium-binding protein